MAMAKIWTFMVLISLVTSLFTGRTQAVSAAVLEGSGAAVELCFTMAAAICLWSGVMAVMREAGLSARLARLMRPLLGRLFPQGREDPELMETISGNVSANLLGLGNAATPLGMRACERMAMRGKSGIASDDMCTLVILNTASIQLLPTTIAAVRASAGCETPFDILPAVWVSSVASVCAGLLASALLRRVWRAR